MIEFNKLKTAPEPWTLFDCVGYIPEFLNELDERPASEQFRSNYIGGWYPFSGFKLTGNSEFPTLRYPGDPPLVPLAYGKLRDELIIVYPYGWVLVRQSSGSYEISRMD